MVRRLRASWARVASLAAIGALSSASPIAAQRRALTPQQQSTPPTQTTVRAELAAVLLQSKRYAEAAREYRALLVRDPSNFDYRLGLARALAWGDQPREAERELRALQSRKPPRLAVDTLLRMVREAIKPTASEAASWVRERPDYPPYRLALARAFATERDGRLAAAQYDSLMPYAGVGRIPPVPVLRREQAEAYLDADDESAGANALRDVLRTSPTDTALRHELAVVLGSGPPEWHPEALAHYDTLLATSRSAVIYAERARLRLGAGDKTGAESDLRASIAIGSTFAAHLMLGDLFRERREYLAAGVMYHAALARVDEDDGDPVVVLAALARLAREERPVTLAPQIGDAGGWRVSTDGAGDNLGVHFAASTFRVTAPLGEIASISVAAMHQYLGERSDLRRLDLNAVGGEASLAVQGGYGPLFTRVGIGGGSLRTLDSPSIPLGSVTGALWLNAWELAVGGSTGPAYPSLLTTTAFRLLNGEDDVLTEKDVSATLGGPIGSADVAVAGQQSRLSDGNVRKTIHGLVRYSLSPGVSAIYDVSRVTYDKRSTRYWDPLEYTAHGLGLELASRPMSGPTVAVSAIPGKAWGRELPYLPAPRGTRPVRADRVVNRSAFQVGATAELGWRDPSWEWSAALSYGRGRAGDYQRLGATLAFRVYR
jgi:tetratricopeptide (TPR) repeat protein